MFNYYKFYKQRDEELQQKAESYAQANTSRITKAVPAVKGKEYYPLRQIFTLYMQWAFVGEKTIVTFYNQEKNAADYLLVSSVVPAEIEMQNSAELFIPLMCRGLQHRCSKIERMLYPMNFAIRNKHKVCITFI